MTEINLKEYEKKVRLNKIFLWYVQFRAFRGRGIMWVSEIKSLLQIDKLEKVALYGGLLILWFPQLRDLPFWVIAIPILIYFIFFEILNVILGWIDFKKGFWKKEQEWGSKNATVAPFNTELRETIKEICKKMGIGHHFKDY